MADYRIMSPIYLTKEIMRYRWNDDNGYDYADRDSINVQGFGRMKQMGIPESERYWICKHVIPQGRKKKEIIFLYFDQNGRLSEIQADKFGDEELKQIIQDITKDLTKMGWVESEVR